MNNTEVIRTNDKLKSYNKVKKGKNVVYKDLPIVLNYLLINIIALFLSRVFIIERLSPFGIAFLAVYLNRGKLAYSVGFSCAIGILSVYGVHSYVYIIPIVSLLIVYKYTSNKIKFTIFKISILSSCIMIITKSIFLFKTNYFLYDFTIIVFEAIMVFALTFIFNYSTNVFSKKFNRLITNEEIISLCIVISLAIAGMKDIELLSFSIRNIIGVFLVLLFSYHKGVTMGTTIGITIGLITSLSTSDITVIISVYAISGLLSGLFKELGKIGVSLGFIIGNIMVTFYINGLTVSIIGLKEIIVAIIIFIVSSKYIKENNAMSEILNDLESDGIYSNRVKDMIYKRLQEFSYVFEELGQTFKKVSQKERQLEQKDISKFVDSIHNEVCEGCPMNKICWENDFYNTYNSMFELMSIIEHNGKVTENSMPNNFKKRCIRHNTLINKSNYIFDVYKLNLKWEKKIVESRVIVSQQLEGVSSIIKDLADEIINDFKFKDDVEKIIWNELKNKNIDVKDVNVIESKNGKFELYIDISRRHDEDIVYDEILPIASKIVGYNLMSEKLFSNKDKQNKTKRFKLIKANRYDAITKVSTSKDSLSTVSGDSYTFGERYNDYFAVLSDGMGVGYNANVESSLVISLLEKFLEAGYDKELAIKTINSILVLKSDDEMLATIDMSIIDLYKAKCKFIKIGSASTFIKKKNEVKIINSNSLPIGILKDVDFNIYEEVLENGDFIIMMSDGVLDCNVKELNKENWMKNVIKSINSVNPQTIADKIIEAALDVSELDEKDDMTVLVTKIWKTM